MDIFLVHTLSLLGWRIFAIPLMQSVPSPQHGGPEKANGYPFLHRETSPLPIDEPSSLEQLPFEAVKAVNPTLALRCGAPRHEKEITEGPMHNMEM